MTIFFRTVILYICVVTAMRIMGKRQMGELQPAEFVIALMISELATIPIESNDIPIMHGIIPIFALVVLELLCSILILKSEVLRKIITGSPIQIIKDGKLLMKRLKGLRICIDDVMEQLRLFRATGHAVGDLTPKQGSVRNTKKRSTENTHTKEIGPDKRRPRGPPRPLCQGQGAAP